MNLAKAKYEVGRASVSHGRPLGNTLFTMHAIGEVGERVRPEERERGAGREGTRGRRRRLRQLASCAQAPLQRRHDGLEAVAAATNVPGCGRLICAWQRRVSGCFVFVSFLGSSLRAPNQSTRAAPYRSPYRSERDDSGGATAFLFPFVPSSDRACVVCHLVRPPFRSAGRVLYACEEEKRAGGKGARSFGGVSGGGRLGETPPASQRWVRRSPTSVRAVVVARGDECGAHGAAFDLGSLWLCRWLRHCSRGGGSYVEHRSETCSRSTFRKTWIPLFPSPC